jgi:hypothetical protein
MFIGPTSTELKVSCTGKEEHVNERCYECRSIRSLYVEVLRGGALGKLGGWCI